MHCLLALLCALYPASLMTPTDDAARLTQPPTVPLAVTGVTVVDVATGRLVPAQTVLIRGNRVVAVVASALSDPPSDARVIDAAGTFMIPGLWDMHAHAFQSNRLRFLPLFIAYGVTGVRDMGSSLPLSALHRLRAEIAAGRTPGPRAVFAGPLLDGPRPVRPEVSVAIATPADARRVVDSLQLAGADFIKVHSRVPRDAYFAVTDEARRWRIAVVGHVPFAVSIAEAASAGQRTVDHLTEYGIACSDRETALRIERARLADARDMPAATRSAQLRDQAADIERTYDAEKCRRLFAHLVAHHTWEVPTLVSSRASAYIDDSTTTNDPRLRALPLDVALEWRAASSRATLAHQPGDGDRAKRAFQTQLLDIMGAMHRAGVGVLAGTDFPSPYVLPGASVHDELALLVNAGFTPLEALQTATFNPARFLGATDSLGTVGVGKIADLILLDANPLVDIHNTTHIRAVVSNGHYLDRAALDRLLDPRFPNP
ncbi:MAG: amidohydrolase family protein [Gemmatimonadaceae bacterium]